MSNNISEAVRKHEETLDAERTELLVKIHSARPFPMAKSDKEAALRRIRAIERELGIEGIPYNSSAFGG